MSSPPVLVADNVVKRHRLGATTVEALRGVSFTARAGELVVLMGPSGSGKSTLLDLLGGLDAPDEGSVVFDGLDWARASRGERTRARRDRLGFIFQGFNLVPVLSAQANVEYPLWLAGVPRSERRDRALAALDEVGLASRAKHRPTQLSGGEQQRVAVARALVHRPLAVIADEPTASLDSAAGAAVLELLVRAASRGTAVVLATHDPAVRAHATSCVKLRDGRVDLGGDAA